MGGNVVSGNRRSARYRNKHRLLAAPSRSRGVRPDPISRSREVTMKEEPSSLSPGARELFRAAREGALPSPADRARSMKLLSALPRDGAADSAPLATLARTPRLSSTHFGAK